MLNLSSAFLLASLAAVSAGAQPSTGRVVNSRDVELKVTLESVMEKRLETVLRKVLASDDVFVVANVELLADPDRPDVEVLPGVVVKKTPASSAPMELPASLVKRVTVTVFLAHSTTDESVALAKATTERMVGLKPERGDVLNVEKSRMPPHISAVKASFLDQALSPGYFLMLAWLAAACWGLLQVLKVFLVPLLSILKEAAQKPTGAGAAADTKTDKSGPPDGEAPVPAETAVASSLAGLPGPDERKLPFAFIKERDLPALELLLLEQSDVTAAIIVQYLPPVLGARALAGMAPARREMVLAYMSKPAVINQVEVRRIEEAVMAKIDYVMGGEEKLVSILDNASIAMQAEILATVRQRDPELARRLDQRVVMIEDIGLLDEAGLTALSRHATVRGMAIVLKSLPHLKDTVLSKLKTGFGEWLTQETGLIGDLPEAVREAEMRLVLQALVRLVREGKVIVRRPSAPPAALPETTFPAPESEPAVDGAKS